MEHLIIGSSKAARGIHPDVFRNHLDKDLYNFAFNLGVSQYGPVYTSAIKRKLQTTGESIFILEVDPWNIVSTATDPNDSDLFREHESFLAGLSDLNAKPNYNYLLNYFEGSFYQLLKPDSRAELLDNGRYKVGLNQSENEINRRSASAIRSYERYMIHCKLSDTRLKALEDLVEYLKAKGDVYLVRLPVHPDLMKLEDSLMPDFDRLISTVVSRSNGYLDMSEQNDEYTYTDGIHLDEESGKEASEGIAKWIKEEAAKIK